MECHIPAANWCYHKYAAILSTVEKPSSQETDKQLEMAIIDSLNSEIGPLKQDAST